MAIYTDIDYKLNTENEDLRLVTDVEAINNSLRNIILTQKGTVPGFPEFGTNIEDVLFELMDEITYEFLKDMIITQIENWETRVQVQEISVQENVDLGQILVTIYYKILKNNEIASTIVKIDLG